MYNPNLYQRAFGNRLIMLPVVSVVAFILVGWLVERVDQEVKQVELAQFAYRVTELQSMVLLMNAANQAKENYREQKVYVGSNPMDWLDVGESAINYLGERRLEEVSSVRGKWVYDPKDGVIAYRPKTMTKAQFSDALEKMPSYPKLALYQSSSVKTLYKKHPEWLRFKVVGLLSKDSLVRESIPFDTLQLVSIH